MKSSKFAFVTEALLYLTYSILGLVEFLIGFRIILKLLGANAAAPFVHWVYETTQPILAPFIGAFPAPKIDGSFIIEFSALFALIIYALAAYLIEELLNFVSSRSNNR